MLFVNAMWNIPDSFEVPNAPQSVIPAPIIENSQEKKKQFAVELAKTNNGFQAACNVCGDNTNEALWIGKNWINDPEVIAFKDNYIKSLEPITSLLDKKELAAKFLDMAEETNASGTFYLLEGKDRLKALELYSKVMGYLDSKDVTPINFQHNKMVVKFVKPEAKENKVTNDDKSIQNHAPLKIKLVS